jgi:hypothetical protein
MVQYLPRVVCIIFTYVIGSLAHYFRLCLPRVWGPRSKSWSFCCGCTFELVGVLVNLMPTFSWCPAISFVCSGTMEGSTVGINTVVLCRGDLCSGGGIFDSGGGAT